MKKEYKFFGWENADRVTIDGDLPEVKTPLDLYDRLEKAWCVETCAPRLRGEWSEDNKTAGQCSITAFLAQDLFGGEVYGVDLPSGGVHCYNVVDGVLFDLASEQFGDVVLDYSKGYVQSREKHFADRDKYERYLLLKRRLENICASE